MKGKVVLFLLVAFTYVIIHFFLGNRILCCTQNKSALEQQLKAQKNIREELGVEHDYLISNKFISQVVGDTMQKYLANNATGNVVFVQEIVEEKSPSHYCLIDLFNPKAEAITNIIKD